MGDCSARKHTPIVSDAQRRLFGAVASGTATKASGLSKSEARRHLTEAKGESLVERIKKKKKKNINEVIAEAKR